ncbi:MAG: hypothetical protein IKP95_10830 [Ruminococcus sp.]|nr:hypothetical protein [Ruminococcus sp.]
MSKTDIPAVCRAAVASGRKMGLELDYTPESVSGIEKVLAGQSTLYREGKLTPVYVWNLSVMLGVYIGQTLMRCGLEGYGYSWQEDSEGVPLLTDGKGNYVSPIYQVRTRIVSGDKEENVRAFFEAILNAAELPK